MGCSSSMDTNSIHNDDDSTTNGLRQDPIQIVQEFVRLDEKIGQLESMCPGPRMAAAEAWVEHMQAKRNELLGLENTPIAKVLSNDQINNVGLEPVLNTLRNSSSDDDIQILTLNDNDNASVTIPNGKAGRSKNVVGGGGDLITNTPNKDLASLALSLGIINDVNKASTHEDFFANLSESALYIISLRYYTEVLEHSKVRLKKLVDEYSILNEQYLNQDGIIAFISGGTYMSRLEESIDSQLETARDVRDRLGSTMEQWRICGMLLRACSNSATLALQQWRHLTKLAYPKEKIQAALECRNSLQASLISLDCAQFALPHVAIKHVSHRQILAVRHCNVYLITDIANLSRYEHTSKVIASYENNMSNASTWLFDTFNNTLKEDFEKAEDAVRKLAKSLRDHRQQIFTAARS